MEYSAYAVMCDCKSYVICFFIIFFNYLLILSKRVTSYRVGKTFKGSKRRVAWKFVFAEDRNESHEVILKHSIVSGKR